MDYLSTGNTSSQLSAILRKHLEVPVFENAFPANYASVCIVIHRENLYNGVYEYHINVYVPNLHRVFGSITDDSYPDIDAIDFVGNKVVSILCNVFKNITEDKIHIRKYIQEKSMHYMNICLPYPGNNNFR